MGTQGGRREEQNIELEHCDLKVGIVIPIYNPGKAFEAVLAAVLEQTYPISKLLIIDSGPIPWQSEILAELGCKLDVELIKILSKDFDHGGTRNLGLSKLAQLDAVVFLTHDAIMLPDCVAELVKFVKVNGLSAAYARQLPRDGATEIEVFERAFNYPPESRIVQGKPTKIDDVFFSDVCSIARVSDFQEVEGFPRRIITCEDVILAVRLLNSGMRIGYCAEARVKHSHKLSFPATVKRFFDTGVMHTIWQEQIPVGTVTAKGVTFVQKATKHILSHRPGEIFSYLGSVLGKFIGYNLGKRYKAIGVRYRSAFSANKAYWGKVED